MKGRNEIVVRDMNWSGNATHTRPEHHVQTRSTCTRTTATPSTRPSSSRLNGNIKGGHVVTASVTFASKNNINDDFSPEFPTGYPSDPANIEAEYGRGALVRALSASSSPASSASRGSSPSPPSSSTAPASPGRSASATTTTATARLGDRAAGVDRFGRGRPALQQREPPRLEGVRLRRLRPRGHRRGLQPLQHRQLRRDVDRRRAVPRRARRSRTRRPRPTSRTRTTASTPRRFPARKSSSACAVTF